MPTFCFIYWHLDLWMERAFCSHAIICKQKNEVKITDTIPLVYPRLWHLFILSRDCECHRCPPLVASALATQLFSSLAWLLLHQLMDAAHQTTKHFQLQPAVYLLIIDTTKGSKIETHVCTCSRLGTLTVVRNFSHAANQDHIQQLSRPHSASSVPITEPVIQRLDKQNSRMLFPLEASSSKGSSWRYSNVTRLMCFPLETMRTTALSQLIFIWAVIDWEKTINIFNRLRTDSEASALHYIS